MRSTCRALAALGLLLGLPAPIRAQPVEERLPVCLACHGATGVSELEGIPSLGAQMPDYIIAQLYLFREKQRIAEPMNDMAAGLADDDLQKIATALAQLPPPPPAPATLDPAAIEQGQALVARYRCGSCHGANLAGQGQIPRIAAQREDYLVKSLVGYKNNSRAAYNPAMNEVSQDIKDEDIPILAKYLAEQK